MYDQNKYSVKKKKEEIINQRKHVTKDQNVSRVQKQKKKKKKKKKLRY